MLHTSLRGNECRMILTADENNEKTFIMRLQTRDTKKSRGLITFSAHAEQVLFYISLHWFKTVGTRETHLSRLG